MRRLVVASVLAVVVAGWTWGQMADRPIVIREKTNAQRLVSRYRTATQKLMHHGPTGTPTLVWRMKTAAGRLVHQNKTATNELVDQSRLSLDARMMSVSPETTYILVLRRKFEEPLFGQFPTSTQRLVDQFPTYTDFSR